MATATNSAIQQARNAGLTDQEIADYLAEKLEPGVVRARTLGIPDEEIIDYLMSRTSLGPALTEQGKRGGQYVGEPLPPDPTRPPTIASLAQTVAPAAAPARRVSAPWGQTAKPDGSVMPTDPYGGYYQRSGDMGDAYGQSFSGALGDRTRELLYDPIARGGAQTAQASNVFTGDTSLESLEGSAHDIAMREREIRDMPTADYMVAAKQRADDAITSLLTPQQVQRLYERRQYFDDLANGVTPKQYLPAPQLPDEDQQQRDQLGSALSQRYGIQQPAPQIPEQNMPGEPMGAPPVIGLTPEQNAAATAKVLWAYLQDPRATINVSLESLSGSATGLALGAGLGFGGGSVAGPPGAAVGTMLGAGSGSFLAEYGNDVLDQMRQEGLDLTNERTVLAALNDQAFMTRVKEHARARAGAVATFDALAGGIGGRVAGTVERALGDTGKTFGKVLGEGAEIAAQGGLGGAGEVAGALAAGDKVDPTAVALEVAGEAGSGGAEILSGRYNAQRAAELEQARANSPQARAAAAKMNALTSAASLLNMIRNSQAQPGTMPGPALTGSRAPEVTAGGITAPSPPVAQGTATEPEAAAAPAAVTPERRAAAVQSILKPGMTFSAPDGDYEVIAVSPHADPNQHYLGLRSPDGEVRPWTAAEFAAHISQEHPDDVQARGVQQLAQLSSALRQPVPGAQAKQLAQLSSILREPSVDVLGRDAQRLTTAMTQMEQPDTANASAAAKGEKFDQILSAFRPADTKELARLSATLRNKTPPPNAKPPTAPTPIEPAPTPAPAATAVSPAQGTTVGGAAPTEKAPDKKLNALVELIEGSYRNLGQWMTMRAQKRLGPKQKARIEEGIAGTKQQIAQFQKTYEEHTGKPYTRPGAEQTAEKPAEAKPAQAIPPPPAAQQPPPDWVAAQVDTDRAAAEKALAEHQQPFGKDIDDALNAVRGAKDFNKYATAVADLRRVLDNAEKGAKPAQAAEEDEAEDRERETSIAEEKAKEKKIRGEYKALRASDPEFNRIAAFVGDDPQYADIGMLQGWKDAKAGVPISEVDAKRMMPTKDMRPHGFNPVQNYLTGYAAGLGLKPHELRATDVPTWLIKVYEHQTGEKLLDENGNVNDAGRAIAGQPTAAAATEQKIDEPMYTGTAPIKTGKTETVITADGTEVETEFEVVEAADLVTSDNPRFPKSLQPRKRDRVVSAEQVSKMAGSIDVKSLGSSRQAEHGAPIIGMDDNLVESGNGRVMALRQMYGRNPKAAQKYLDFVAETSGQDVSGMSQPVLVRRRTTEMTDEQRVKWTKEANKTSLAKMSAAESAAIDQEKLTPAVMNELPENMDEPLKLVEGKGLEFVERFVAQFTPAERGELIDADGKVSSIALARAKAALLQKAYGGTPAGDAAIRRAAESTDSDAQTLVNTLMHFAPAFAQLKDDIAAGRVQEQADIGPQIAEAVEVVRAAGSPGAVTRWLNTEGLLNPKDATVKQLIQTFYTFDGRGDAKRLRSAAAIGDTLAGYLKEARLYTPAGAGGGLFGEEEAAVLNPAAQLAKLNVGRKEQEQKREQQTAAQAKGQGGLFTAGGKPSATASTGARDESSGEETQPAGSGESGDASDAETSAEDDEEEVTELDEDVGTKAADESGVESGMDEPADTEADDTETPGIEEGRSVRAGEKMPLPSTSRENLMTYLGIKPEEFRRMGGERQWKTVTKALMDRFGFAGIFKHKNQYYRNAIDHLLDAFESLHNLAEAMGAGTRIASLNGRITLHMREKPGRTKGYFRYKPEGNEPGNTIAIYNQEDWYSHEFGHAFDYDLMERAGGTGAGGITAMIRTRQSTGMLPNTLQEALADLMNAMYFDYAEFAALIQMAEHQLAKATTPSRKAQLQKRLEYIRSGGLRDKGGRTEFYKRAANGPLKKYLTKPTELFARVFEAYISNKIQQQKALGLVKFLGATDAIYRDEADAWIKRTYPHGDERQRIFAALDNLIGQVMREDIYNVGTQSPGIQNSEVNLGLIDPVAQAKANGTPLTPDIIAAHNLTKKAAKTFLEDELKRNDTLAKNFEQLINDLKAGSEGAGQHMRAAMAKLASTPDTVFAFLEARFPQIRILRKIRNELSDAHIAGRDKPIGFYREWQRTEHSITNDIADRMAAVGVIRNMPADEAEHFWDVAHGLAKPRSKAVERQVDQFLYELARLWKLRDKTGENIGFVSEEYVNRVFLKDIADNPKFHTDLLRLRVHEKSELIIKLQSQRLAATDPEEITRLKAAVKRAEAIDPAADAEAQIARMKGLIWGEPVYLGAATEDSARERVFGPAADEILKEYYVKDPATLLQMYGSAAARGVAMRRRYGSNPKEVFQGWLNQTALELPSPYAALLKNAMEISMGFRRENHGSLTRMVNGAANVTTASMLGRAVFPNLSEPLNILAKGLDVGVSFGALMKSMVPWMTSTATRKRFKTADRFGRLSGTLVDAASSMTAMAQHIGEDTVGNGILARFSVRAYWFNAMSGLTAWQQKIINRCAFELFYQSAAEIRKGGPEAELHRQWFREHGINNPDAIAKFLEKSDNIEDLDLVDTLLPGTGLTVANAITQFVHTTIQHPTPSTKHMQANRGVVGVLFRLTSWITTNFINWARYMKNRAGSALSGKYGGEELLMMQRLRGEREGQQLTAHERIFGRVGGVDITVGQRFSAMAAPAATALITMYAAQALWVCARMALTNGDEWEDRGKTFWDRFTNRKTQLQIAQYWGVLGWAMNTAIDVAEGTRFNRGPAATLMGPAYGGWAQDAERLTKAAVSAADYALGEKQVSQAVMNNAAQAGWHIGSVLFSVGLLNTLPTQKPLSRLVGFAWSVIGTSPWAAHRVADLLTGEKTAELREDKKAGDANASLELAKRKLEDAKAKRELAIRNLGKKP